MNFPYSDDPFVWFGAWFDHAKEVVKVDPNAVALATVDAQNNPSLRIVLLKQWDDQGFVFYTNYTSRKGQQLLETRKAAMTLFWRELGRQIRIEGIIEEVSPQQADAYFASRPRASQIGAWASNQSSELEDRQTLLDRIDEVEARFDGAPVPRPPHWSGFRLKPLLIEFWEAGDFRIHDRMVFSRHYIHQAWSTKRLNP